MDSPKFTELLSAASGQIDIDVLISRIARHAAKEALRDLGLDDPSVRKSFKEVVRVSDDLKEVAQAWRALGWVRKAVVWIGGTAAALVGIIHFFGDWHK